MELIYVWLEDFHPFEKHTSINLSSRFNVTCVTNEVAKTLKFTIEKNPNFIPNFFESVANVTALIGKNGTGKSSFLSFLTELFMTPKSDAYSVSRYAALFFDTEKQTFYLKRNLYNYKQGRVGMAPSRVSDSWKVEVNPPKDYEYSPECSLIGVQTVFNSPVFGQNLSIDHLAVNVSTDFLLFYDEQFGEGKEKQVDIHRYKNVERQITFVDQFENNEHIKKRFLLPDALVLKVLDHKTEDYWGRNLTHSETKNIRIFFLGESHEIKGNRGCIWDEINKMANRIDPSNIETESDEFNQAKLDHIRLWFLWNFAEHFFKVRNSEDHLWDKAIGVKAKDLEGKTAWDAFRFFLENQTWTNDKGKAAIKFLDELYKVFSINIANRVDFHENQAIELVDKKMALPIIKAHDAYKRSLPTWKNDTSVVDLIQIDWRNLSSGEKAFLDIFSRLLYAKQLVKEREKDEFSNKTTPTQWVYLLLDEGDLYFHPEWQRQYLNIILDIVPEIFKGIKLQIILTSHSPFVILDLPKDNIVFLKREKEVPITDESDSPKKKVTTVDNDHIKIQNTFAGNIHTLLADGFFLDDGLMGAFAQKKIKDALKQIDTKDLKHKSEIERLIAIIGEPIIRQKMRQLFEEKYKEELLKEEIIRLEKELEKAKNKFNKLS